MRGLLAQHAALPARTVVLVPYAQLMPVARRHWAAAVPDGFAPRFETTMNWAGKTGFVPGTDDQLLLSSLAAVAPGTPLRDGLERILRGNTGALMAGGTLRLRMMNGVDRPALAAVIPRDGGNFILIDAGANPDQDRHVMMRVAPISPVTTNRFCRWSMAGNGGARGGTRLRARACLGAGPRHARSLAGRWRAGLAWPLRCRQGGGLAPRRHRQRNAGHGQNEQRRHDQTNPHNPMSHSTAPLKYPFSP